MKIKYLVINDRASLVVTDADLKVSFGVEDQLWIFIHGHKHFVLRSYYRECKDANVMRPYHDECDDYDAEQACGFPVIFFNSSWEKHKPYVLILQKELKLTIENLPG